MLVRIAGPAGEQQRVQICQMLTLDEQLAERWVPSIICRWREHDFSTARKGEDSRPARLVYHVDTANFDVVARRNRDLHSESDTVISPVELCRVRMKHDIHLVP